MSLYDSDASTVTMDEGHQNNSDDVYRNSSLGEVIEDGLGESTESKGAMDRKQLLEPSSGSTALPSYLDTVFADWTTDQYERQDE